MSCLILKKASEKDDDTIIRSEAFSEYATTHGLLISVKARVEIKAIDAKTGKIIATDRQTTVAVDVPKAIIHLLVWVINKAYHGFFQFMSLTLSPFFALKQTLNPVESGTFLREC